MTKKVSRSRRKYLWKLRRKIYQKLDRYQFATRYPAMTSVLLNKCDKITRIIQPHKTQ